MCSSTLFYFSKDVVDGLPEHSCRSQMAKLFYDGILKFRIKINFYDITIAMISLFLFYQCYLRFNPIIDASGVVEELALTLGLNLTHVQKIKKFYTWLVSSEPEPAPPVETQEPT